MESIFQFLKIRTSLCSFYNESITPVLDGKLGALDSSGVLTRGILTERAICSLKCFWTFFSMFLRLSSYGQGSSVTNSAVHIVSQANREPSPPPTHQGGQCNAKGCFPLVPWELSLLQREGLCKESCGAPSDKGRGRQPVLARAG